jgi:hypothetical protein
MERRDFRHLQRTAVLRRENAELKARLEALEGRPVRATGEQVAGR